MAAPATANSVTNVALAPVASLQNLVAAPMMKQAESVSCAPITSAPVCVVSPASLVCHATPSLPGSKKATTKATTLPPLEQTLLPAKHPLLQEVLELDELWSFVQQRKNKRWVWFALCRRTRQVLAYAPPKGHPAAAMMQPAACCGAASRPLTALAASTPTSGRVTPTSCRCVSTGQWARSREKPIILNALTALCASA